MNNAIMLLIGIKIEGNELEYGKQKKISKNKNSFQEGSIKWTKLSPTGEEKK